MSESRRLFKPNGLFLGLLLIVPLIAFSIVQLNGPAIRKHAFDNLNIIAKLKAEEVENWLAERQIDLEFLAAAEEFARHAERLALTGNADSRAFVVRRLEAYSKSRYYHSAILLNSSGQVVATAGESNETSDPATQQLLQSSLKSGKIVRSDLYRDANTGHVHLDYVLPLRGAGGHQQVAVLLHVPADDFLFPLIQTWPTPSPTAEIMLVRRDGKDVLFLNELRHRHGTALSQRRPLDSLNLPAAAALLSNKPQTMVGTDYRGVSVFAVTRPIAGTPWHLVAKIDREEVMEPLKELIFWVSLLALIAVAAIAIAIWRLWRQVLHTQRLELAAQAVAMQQEGEAQYRRLHESMMDAYVMVDMAGNLLEFNSAYQNMLGYSYEELRGLTYVDLTPEKWHASEARIVEEQILSHGQSQVYEKEYMRKDGSVFPVELRVFLLRGKDNQPEAMWAIVRDITERKRNEEELKTFFNLIPELVCVASVDGHFLKINAMWQEVLGYTEQEILATPFLDLIHPDDRDATMQEVKRQLAGNSTMHFINRYRCKDGAYRWLEWGAAPAIDGRLLFAAARDITERLLLDRKLSESEQHFRTLANASSALIWTSGQDKLCDYFNEPWLRFTGRSLEQELGNGWAEGVHPDDLDRCRETYFTAFDQRKPFSMEYRLRHADGSFRWLRDDGNPRYDSQGVFLGYIGFCIDITAQKELMAELELHRYHLEGLVEERTRELSELVEKLKGRELALDQQQRFLKTVTDALPGMVSYWSDDLRCGFANISYQEWFGKQPEEMIGMRMQDLMGEELFHKNEPHIRAALRGEPQHFGRSMVKADGSIGHTWANYVPDTIDGRTRGFFVLVTDVTELKEIQIELEKANTELNERTREAESANRAKSAFLANMSHELRTPLNAILGFSDVLRRTPGLSETQEKSLEIIHKSGDHLLSLINDILEISKIESGRAVLDLAPFDSNGMILDITNMLRPRAREKNLKLQVDQAADFHRYLVADEPKLRQVIINLISNAIKATEQGGVMLRLGLKHNHAEHLLIEVEDSGCGIAPADQARILEPFVQAGDQGRQQGTGLGLAITRQFVELMGGNLSFTSTVGQGSTFRVDVPVQLARPEEIPQASKALGEVISLEPGQPTFRVLVVEDDSVNQRLLMDLLEGVGFFARVAENGAEAVAQFQSWRPHFIWMDRRMPVMDGMEATRQIRALAGGETVKIAAVTASTFKEEDEELMVAGFDAIVHKPFRPGQVFECMEQLLGLRFVRAEAEAGSLPELSAAALAALPASLRQNLTEALVILDSERILDTVNAISQTDPELGAALRVRMQRYDYEPILALLQAGPFATGKGETGQSKER